MYRIDRNNYYTKPKSSTIYTPAAVSNFLYRLVSKKIKNGLVLDPCSGQGSLLEPWKKRGYQTLGIDVDKQSSADIQTDFLSLEQWEHEKPTLIVCNPPFNGYGRQLASEVWLKKIINLFNKEIPLVLFTPVGLRNNLTSQSLRYHKFISGEYPTISSIITLPKNIFSGVIFHSEILLFNIQGLKPHYYLPKYNARQLINHCYYERNKAKLRLNRQTKYRLKKSLNNPVFSLNKASELES
jgi:type I restriction enzyme M protein